jgi:hypothetical protein
MTGSHHPETGAEAAVAVAERGLAAWRDAKAAWLSEFATFAAATAEEARSPLPERHPLPRRSA